jgi:hypothetical protein
MSRQSSSAKRRWSGPACKPEGVKELLVANILSDALRPNAARQIGTGGERFLDLV